MAKNKTDKPPPVAVAIVDTHRLLREAIAALLEQRDQYRVTWMGERYKQLDKALDEGLEVCLVLVALSIGEDDGFTTLEHLRDDRPELFRVAYVHRHDEASVLRAYRCGSQALLHDTVEGKAVLSMLQAVVAGVVVHTPMSQGLLLENPDGLTQAERNRERMKAQMTRKEMEVLQAIWHFPDHTVDKLAKQLGLSPNTVDSHLKRLFELFDLRSKTGVLMAAVRLGLLPGAG